MAAQTTAVCTPHTAVRRQNGLPSYYTLPTCTFPLKNALQIWWYGDLVVPLQKKCTFVFRCI